MLWFFDCGVMQKAIGEALRAAMNAPPQPKLKEIEPLHFYQLFTAAAIWVVGMTVCLITFCIEWGQFLLQFLPIRSFLGNKVRT